MAAADVAHRRALKAALNSCVRLCVVAPTVNINLDDRSRSFCSGLPEEKIRAFVEGSVLPRFTRVLLQPGSEGEAGGGGGDSASAGRRWRRRRRSSDYPNDGGNNSGSTATLRANTTAVVPAVTLGPSSLSSPSSSPSNTCAPRSSGNKAFAAAAGSPSTASVATAVDNPAVDQRQLLAESDDDDEVETDDEVGGGGGGGGSGQGDFDKWLRDLLVDMQTSIERHVASVFQTQTAAMVP